MPVLSRKELIKISNNKKTTTTKHTHKETDKQKEKIPRKSICVQCIHVCDKIYSICITTQINHSGCTIFVYDIHTSPLNESREFRYAFFQGAASRIVVIPFVHIK